MTKAIEMARQTGASFVGVRGGSHFGACAFYTLQAVDAGMVGLAMTNTGPSMAPWGAAQAYFGTNPLSFAFPAGQHRPVVLDMATSLVARGKIILAAKKGEAIPLGWALDETGRPTTDAQAALRGTVLPAGGPKGSGLAFVVEVLTSVLTGALIGAHVPPMYEDFQNPTNCGFFFGAIDVAAFMPLERFKERIDAMIGEIRPCHPPRGRRRSSSQARSSGISGRRESATAFLSRLPWLRSCAALAPRLAWSSPRASLPAPGGVVRVRA